MIITSFSKFQNYVVTISSLNPACFRTHSEMTGFGSAHSDYVSRRRAFNRGSAILYCNKDILTTFLTLTYKKQHNDYDKIKNDLKNVFSRNHISYLAVVERHKTGYFHIHAITSNLENIISLRRGKYSWADWRAGFSDVKFLSGVDDKFRVEKYIFKYMLKSEKIGGRYFLKSRDLTVKRFSYPLGTLPSPMVNDWDIDFKSYNIYTGNDYSVSVERRYYERDSSKKYKDRKS